MITGDHLSWPLCALHLSLRAQTDPNDPYLRDEADRYGRPGPSPCSEAAAWPSGYVRPSSVPVSSRTGVSSVGAARNASPRSNPSQAPRTCGMGWLGYSTITSLIVHFAVLIPLFFTHAIFEDAKRDGHRWYLNAMSEEQKRRMFPRKKNLVTWDIDREA